MGLPTTRSREVFAYLTTYPITSYQVQGYQMRFLRVTRMSPPRFCSLNRDSSEKTPASNFVVGGTTITTRLYAARFQKAPIVVQTINSAPDVIAQSMRILAVLKVSLLPDSRSVMWLYNLVKSTS
ncbi:hypothetical protein TNCV_929211 [Trichonephila clavipes]|nr:hypothetical protein TNCV_929211 [Trichonephila clavipes]